MKVLITGSSGFLGSHITAEWDRKGHQTFSVGRSNENDICCDLSASVPSIPVPVDYVIHVAGKAHVVPKTQKEENDFFNINVNGTSNLLVAIDLLPEKPKGFLFISSVSVYGRETGEKIGEEEPLNAKDAYGRSKIEAETLITDWGLKNKVPTTIIRPALIVGKNAPGNLEQMIVGIKNGRYANIAKGKAQRSMVLAQDIARFSQSFLENPGTFNVTDGQHPSFYDLSSIIGAHLSKKIPNIPMPIATLMAWTGDILGTILSKEMPFSSRKLKKMTYSLTFDDSRARAIGWTPKKVLANQEKWLS